MNYANQVRELQQQLIQQQLACTKLTMQNMQLTRMAWSLVNKMGGRVEMAPEEIPVLWHLDHSEKGENNTLILKSKVLPDLEESTIIKCADFLRNTTKDLGEAMKEYELHYYPMPYVELRMRKYIYYDPTGQWLPIPGKGDQGPN